MNAKERLHRAEEELKKERQKNHAANTEILRLHELMKTKDRRAKMAADQLSGILHAAYTDIALKYGQEIEGGYREITMQSTPVKELDRYEILTARSDVGLVTVRVREKELNHADE